MNENINLKKILKNYQIIRAIVLILCYIAITIISITAIPYAIVRGACNLDYYEDWFDFIIKYSPFIRHQ